MKKFIGISTMFALAAFMMLPLAAGAYNGNGNDRHDRNNRNDRNERTTETQTTTNVTNNSSASVTNISVSVANTGGNYAGGSYGGDGGDSANRGDGGNGGGANLGGSISTGMATTNTHIYNDVNMNRTTVDNCGCEARNNNRGDRTTRTTVNNQSSAEIENGTLSFANTGINEADGSYGGDGGDNEGDNNNRNDRNDRNNKNRGNDRSSNNGSNSGDGGQGGGANDGGAVLTGDSHTSTSVITVVNRNITRIR